MEIKYYKAGIACRSLASKDFGTSSGSKASVIEFKSEAGYEYSMLSTAAASNIKTNLTIFILSKMVASSDSEFNINDYSAQDSIGTVISFVQAEGITGRTYRISVKNDSDENITVKSFKGFKNLSASNNSGIIDISCLLFQIKLDSPVTIAPGITKDFVIDINFQNE